MLPPWFVGAASELSCLDSIALLSIFWYSRDNLFSAEIVLARHASFVFLLYLNNLWAKRRNSRPYVPLYFRIIVGTAVTFFDLMNIPYRCNSYMRLCCYPNDPWAQQRNSRLLVPLNFCLILGISLMPSYVLSLPYLGKPHLLLCYYLNDL